MKNKLVSIIGSVILPIAGCQNFYTSKDMLDSYEVGFNDGYESGMRRGIGVKKDVETNETKLIEAISEDARRRDLHAMTDKMNLHAAYSSLANFYEEQGDEENAEFFQKLGEEAYEQGQLYEVKWELEPIVQQIMKGIKRKLEEDNSEQ